MTVSLEQMAATWRAREAARAARARARADRLIAAVPEAAGTLRARGATAVYLFGSLVQGVVHEGSDVDLAVEGLPAPAYFEALSDLMELFAGPVDLVRLEDASASLADRIHAEGRRV